MVTQFGLGPLFDGMGLIFPVLSYCGWITISLTSCREMMPDPAHYCDCLDEAFDDLRTAARKGRPPRKRGARRSAAKTKEG